VGKRKDENDLSIAQIGGGKGGSNELKVHCAGRGILKEQRKCKEGGKREEIQGSAKETTDVASE